MNYKELHSSESHGVYGGFYIKILVSTNHEVDLSLPAIQNAAYDAARKIHAEVMASTISMNKRFWKPPKKNGITFSEYLLSLYFQNPFLMNTALIGVATSCRGSL